MPVASILSYLGSGMSIADILNEWPELETEDILQTLSYAAQAMEERFIPASTEEKVLPRNKL